MLVCFCFCFYFLFFFRSFDFQKGTVKKHQNDEWSLSNDTNEPSNSQRSNVQNHIKYWTITSLTMQNANYGHGFIYWLMDLKNVACVCVGIFFLFSSISGKQSHFDFHKAKHAQWHPPITTNIHISYNRNVNCGMNIDQELICQAILLALLGSALLYNFSAILCIQYDSAKDNWLD